MYILILAENYPTKKWPLLGIFEFDQAKALRGLGHKIVFASIDMRSIRRWRKWGIDEFVKDGVKVYNLSIPLGRFPWWILHYAGKAGLIYLYYKINKENGKPDIVHSHFTLLSAVASILKRKHKLPLIITEHSSEINKKTISQRTIQVGNIAFRNADKIISVSSHLSLKIKQHFGFDSIVVPNIVDNSIFKFSPKKKSNSFSFISIGSLVNGKGHDILIEAFHNASFNKDVFLNIIGEGDLDTQLQARINKLNLDSQIKLLGLLSRSEIAKQMQKSDAFVLASRGETFGVVYIEALATGLPVIATACGGPEDFVDEKNGIIIPINDVLQLTKSMHDIYQNINMYNKEEISKQARKKFSSEEIGTKLTELYQTITINFKHYTSD
jgi:glycosyltransferase involved in cell wall biosynthesis